MYDFGSDYILVPSTNSHFFRPLRKKVLNLAPVHYMPDEVPVRVAQVSVVHCKLIEVCQRCSVEFWRCLSWNKSWSAKSAPNYGCLGVCSPRKWILLSYDVKNYADLRGCYPPWPLPQWITVSSICIIGQLADDVPLLHIYTTFCTSIFWVCCFLVQMRAMFFKPQWEWQI